MRVTKGRSLNHNAGHVMNVIGLEHNGTPHVVTNPTESAQREKEGDQLEGDAYQCPREGLVESHRKEEAAAPKLP